ncbi:serine/threonine-protein kinase [Paraliomyxa miuraensis]|uniref:serine/threonine-protein kinase n=1 Tax=Paraliomyxa miuraensis TaxID=376150 RepID=UPI00225785D5|nr:serine/threonine-protein kinase [Paraliomyxa miuraensis]MCX4240558.1 serine/threonine protein kinase [Paraliomyxa miuraensis]
MTIDAAASPLQPGDVYEGFEIRRVLGQGAFAWVYEASHANFPQPVALKLSKAPVDSEETALRALREIRILGTLSNPHVVHIFDHGLGEDERWYMVMELLQGGELTSLHDFDQPMPPLEAVRLIQQACLGLDEAHREGIVHRDVKPDNLWLQPDRSVKVLDFGLARAWDTDNTIGANATMGHMLIGTPHYAQPEQIKTGKLTPASDVYSLGVVLYELLVGRTPLFVDQRVSQVREKLIDDPLKWLVAHVKEPVVPLERYPEGQRLPRRLLELVASTLAKDPVGRPATAGVLGNRLAWIMHHDLGHTMGAVLRVIYPSGAEQRHLVLPGVHRLGVGTGPDIKLANDESPTVFASLEWAGAPHQAELRPLVVDGSVRANGSPVTQRVRLPAGTMMEMGAFRLELRYPAPKPAPRPQPRR